MSSWHEHSVIMKIKPPKNRLSKKSVEQLQTAVSLHQRGQLELAQAIYETVLRTNPSQADALHLLGVIAFERKQFTKSVELIDRAVLINPRNAAFYSNRGLALKELKKLDAAVADYDKAIALKFDYVEAHYSRGLALRELKKLNAAIADYDKAIALKPDFAEAYCDRGIALMELGKLDAAVADYDKAIALKPDYASAYNNRGNALKRMKKLDAAVVDYDKAIALKPDYVLAYNNRGTALEELMKLEAAVSDYDKAIVLKPDFAVPYYNRGVAQEELKKLDAALADYDKAIELNPNYAEAYWNKSLLLLLRGAFQDGFSLYEWRWKNEWLKKIQRNFKQPLWLGQESVRHKTILLHAEQGFGDTIQFCRYAELCANAGANVVLEVQKSLVGLLRSLRGVSEIIAQGTTLPAFDCHCPLLSLPLAFKTTLNTIPAPMPYLKAHPSKTDIWGRKLGSRAKPRVGLTWSGSPSHINDRNRSINLASIIPHLPDNCEYIGLQKDLREEDRDTLKSASIIDLGDELTEFSDTAALCELMDLVISVDTRVRTH